MPSAASQTQTSNWLLENGPIELERLLHAIVYHPSAPILIADDEGNYRDASAGAGKFWIPREQIIGSSLSDLVEPGAKPHVSELWRALLHKGEQAGTLRLGVGRPLEVE